MPAPSTGSPHPPTVSGRARDFSDEFDRITSDPRFLASLESMAKCGPGGEPPDVFEDKDLVARLKEENEALWKELIQNKFCLKMKDAKKDDPEVLKGFTKYMIQDFLYLVYQIYYQADRGYKATTVADFKESMTKVAKRPGYATPVLDACIDSLGVPGPDVLKTPQSEALKKYIELLHNAAKDQTWVLSLVAVIPCVQSYYEIAHFLNKNMKERGSKWDTLWVKENDNPKWAKDQADWFGGHYEQWKGEENYKRANKMFQDACKAEIALWEVAL